MKVRVWILAIAVAIAGVNLAFVREPFGQGQQIFNISQRIETDDWAKASATVVLSNHFASSQITNFGYRDKVGLRLEKVIGKIYEQPAPDDSEPYVELTGTSAATQLISAANWKGTSLCSGEAEAKCTIYVIWPSELEGAANVKFVTVHLAEMTWGLVEASLLESKLKESEG